MKEERNGALLVSPNLEVRKKDCTLTGFLIHCENLGTALGPVPGTLVTRSSAVQILDGAVEVMRRPKL